MKKFTRLWQLLMIVLLTTSVAVGQKQMTFKGIEKKAKPNAKAQKQVQLQEAMEAEAQTADFAVEEQQAIETVAVPQKALKSDKLSKLAEKTGYVKVNQGHSSGLATPNPNVKPLPFYGNPTDGGTAYVFDLINANAVTFDSDFPGTFTTIGANSNQAFAGDYDALGNWYYIDYGTVELYSVDPLTGLSTLVAPVTGLTTGQSTSGMACDKNTGVMYVSSTDIVNSDIYTIDLTTGVLTLLGTSTIPGLIEIAVDGHGTLWGWCIVTDASYTINKVTGVGTLVGPLGIDLNYAQGGNYDPVNNEVYMFAYAASGGLYKLNRANGMANLVGGFQGGAEVDGGGFPGTSVLPTTDAGANWVIAPQGSGVFGGTEVVEATIFNYGSTAISNFNVQYTINAGTPVVENIAGPIAPGTGIVYAFTATADLSAPGNYTIEVCTNIADAVPANDCSSATVTTLAAFDCDWYIIGIDSYGDGWNGGSIDIYSNSVLIHNWAGPATTGPDQFDFGIYEGETLDFIWNPGSWDSEVTFTIYDNFNGVIFASVPGSPASYTGVAASCLPPACPDPTGLSTTLITPTSARANWAPGGSESLWNFEWGPAGFALGTGNLTTGWTNPNPFGNPYFNITGLTSGASYDWYVQADCGTDAVSNWIGPINFATSCVAFTAPWTEDFSSWPLPCWDMTGGTYNWVPYTTAAPYCAEASYWGQTSGNTDVMTTNTIDISGLTTPGLWFFWSHLYNATYPLDQLEVFVTDDNGVTWNSVWLTAGTALNSNDGATSTAPGSFVHSGYIDLSGFGANIKVQFFGTSGYGPDLFVDNVTVDDIPACPDPYGISITNVGETSADLAWTSNSGLSNVEYGPAGFTLGTGTPLTGVTSPQTLSGLMSSTGYDVYVQDDCGTATSGWAGPNSFTTLTPPQPTGELLYAIDLEAICGTNRILGSEFFPPTGTLWVTASTSSAAGGNEIYEVDPYNGILLNTYPQVTTSIWGMRDLANDGTYIYSGDDNGFYQIDPTDGSQVTLFSGTTGVGGVIRALARNPVDGHFFTKSFTGMIYEFDATGTVYNSFANTGSSYGAGWDPNTGMLWLHMTAQFSFDVNEFAEVDPTTGLFTGNAIGVPDQPCSVIPIVGGGFIDFGNMYPGRNVIGATLQATPDVLHVVEFSDTGFPDQTSNFAPYCGELDVSVNGTLTWDFGANTNTYDLWLGPAGAMVQVVSGGTVSGPNGSYAYTGLAASTQHEWRVDGYNITDLGPTMGYTYNFTTSCGTYVLDDVTPLEEIFQTNVNPACWTNTSSNPVSNGLWEYGNATTNTMGYDASGTPDHTGSGGYYAWADGSTPVVTDITMLTPMLDVSAVTTPMIEFYLFSYNVTYASSGYCTFYCDFYDGTIWNNLLTYSGSDPDWQYYSFDLSGYTITGDVQFRFVVDQSTATTAFYNDIAIDDIFVGNAPACPDPSALGVANLMYDMTDLVWTSNSGLSNIERGPTGFVPGSGIIYGVTSPYGISGLTENTTYDFYVQDDCGGGLTSMWVGPFTFTTPFIPPPNDDCANAQPIAGPYPQTVTGTTIGATESCPVILPMASGDVWYAIDLPFAMNYVTMDICGDALLDNGWIVASTVQCSCDLLDYIYASTWVFAPPCVTGMEFLEVPGPTTIYYPMATGTFQENFTFTVNVQEAPIVDVAPASFTANVVEGNTAAAHMNIGNLGDFRLDYSADVVFGTTVVCNPVGANYWTGTTDGTTFTDVSEVRGYSLEDGWFMFDISAIPPGATVTNVEFFGYVNATNWPYWSMTPVTNDPLITDPATLYADINAEASTGYYLYQNEPSTFPTGWHNYVLGGTANADLEAAVAQGWFAMGMASRDNSTTYFLNWDGWNQANPPYIEVTFAAGPIDWLTLDGGASSAGSVLGGDPAADVLLGFDATGVPPGTYNVDITVSSNDPVTPSVIVPVTMNVFAAPGYDVNGTLLYGGNPAKPMDNVAIDLVDGPIINGTALTDLAGAFLFAGIADGGYNYVASTTKAVAGAFNIADAFVIRQYLSTGNPPLNALQLFAGDVTGNGFTNIQDAFLMRQYLSSGPQPLWMGPAWKFTDPAITVSGATVTQDFDAVVSGDVNLSFTPPAGK